MTIALTFKNKSAANRFAKAMDRREYDGTAGKGVGGKWYWYSITTEATEAAMNTIAEDMVPGDTVEQEFSK